MSRVAVITGFAPGLATDLARRLAGDGYQVAGLSRSGKSPEQAVEGFRGFACDVSRPEAVAETFAAMKSQLGAPEVLIHNAAQPIIREFLDTSPEQFEQLWRTACLGGMLCAQQVVPGMLEAGRGTILFTGATASLRGGAKFSAFASAKFALRGLAQSLARAYGPRGIHVVHTIIDGIIWGERADKQFGMDRSSCMEPDDIAEFYMHLIAQKPSSWSHEIDLRPAQEKF